MRKSLQKEQNPKMMKERIKYMKIRGILSPRHNTTKFHGIENILMGGGKPRKKFRSNITIWKITENISSILQEVNFQPKFNTQSN